MYSIFIEKIECLLFAVKIIWLLTVCSSNSNCALDTLALFPVAWLHPGWWSLAKFCCHICLLESNGSCQPTAPCHYSVLGEIFSDLHTYKYIYFLYFRHLTSHGECSLLSGATLPKHSAHCTAMHSTELHWNCTALSYTAQCTQFHCTV